MGLLRNQLQLPNPNITESGFVAVILKQNMTGSGSEIFDRLEFAACLGIHKFGAADGVFHDFYAVEPMNYLWAFYFDAAFVPLTDGFELTRSGGK